MSRARIAPFAVALLALSQEPPPAAVPLRLIVVNSADDAGRLLQQLQNGADFAVLAREKSVDATSIDGGLLGKVDPATLRGELRTAVQGLGPGQLSAVFRLPTGFAIVKVLPPGELAGLESTERARRFAVSAEGSIHFDFDISGLNEAEAALNNYPKDPGWNLDLRQICAARKDSYADVIERAEKMFATANPGRAPADTMSLRVAGGQLHAYRGEMDQAVAHWEAAYKVASSNVPRALPVLGNLAGGSGVMYLPRTSNFDATMTKFTPIGKSERRGLRLQAQAYNVFNHTEYIGVNSTIQYSATGAVTNGSSVGVFNGTLPNRVMAFSARFQF